MSIESPADLEGLRRAGNVTRLTLDALEAHVRAGITTAELNAVAGEIFAKHGARSAPALVYGFPGHVLLSINDEIVNGVPGPIPNEYHPRQADVLTEGLVLTIEPMITAGSPQPVEDARAHDPDHAG